MKPIIMVVVILALTGALVAWGLLAPGTLASSVGIASGSAMLSHTATNPEQALTNLLALVQSRDWNAVHSQLANPSDIDTDALAKDLAGGNGGLRTLSNLQSWELHPLHYTDDQAQVRGTLHWSTPVGQVDEVRDFQLKHNANTWRVVWPVPHFASVPAQIIPVNYLRWDLVASDSESEWGGGSVDAPHVRIVSMNAVEYRDGTLVMGEVVNEDTIPAFANVNATLVDGNGNTLDEENSFDKISHTLLPKQVSPYRIDFPNIRLQSVKNVRMDVRATLVPASADPVIGVMNQTLQTDAQGRKVLQGELLNQSGQVVNIPHVIAGFYDNSGRVIWVADGYVDRALLPQTPEPFAVEIPASVAGKVQSYHAVVNQYSIGHS